ncbi:hypothetical protein ACKKBG_A19195 [Auxenochlorella protothecoides x Auxenochlorella symbiontica]
MTATLQPFELRVQHIFSASDRNADSGLDEDEVAWLLRSCNPDSALTEEQIQLIVEEIWASFSDHISSHGLTRDGLRSLYTSGLADIEHDYRLVCDRAADALEAKRALEETPQATPPVPSPLAPSPTPMELLSAQKHLAELARQNSGEAGDLIPSVRAASVTSPSGTPQPAGGAALRGTPPARGTRPHDVARDTGKKAGPGVPVVMHPLAFPGATPWTVSPFPRPASMAATPASNPALPAGEARLATPAAMNSTGPTAAAPGSTWGVSARAALSDSLPATPADEEEESAGDVFAALRTPAPPGMLGMLRPTPRAARRLSATPPPPVLVHLALLDAEDGFDPAPLVAALQESCPEGSRVNVRGLAPAPGGGLVASLAVTLDDAPDAEAALEEAQYLAAVLRLEPGQVLSPDTFGRVVAVGAPPAASGHSPATHSVAAVTAGPCEVAEAGPGVGPGDGAVGRRGDGSPGEVAATYAPAHLSEDDWDLPGTPMPGHSAASAAASPGPAISPDAFASLPTMVTKAPRPTEGRLRWSEEEEAGAAGVHTPETSPALPTAEPARRARRVSVHVPDTSVEAWEAPRVERTGGLFRRREVAVPSRQEEMLASLRSRLPDDAVVEVRGGPGAAVPGDLEVEVSVTLPARPLLESVASSEQPSPGTAAVLEAVTSSLPRGARLLDRERQSAGRARELQLQRAPASLDKVTPQDGTNKQGSVEGGVPAAPPCTPSATGGGAALGATPARSVRGTSAGTAGAGVAVLGEWAHAAAGRAAAAMPAASPGAGRESSGQATAVLEVEQSEGRPVPAVDSAQDSPGDRLAELTRPGQDWSGRTLAEVAEYSRVLGAELRRRLADGGANVDDVAAVQAAVDSLPPPPRAAAALEVGQALGAAGRHAEALTSFRAAAAAAPRDPLAHFRAGNACFALAHYVAAATEYRAALSLCAAAGEAERPLAVKVHVNLGITLEASGLLMAACEEYEQATALNTNHFRAFKLTGSAKYALGDFDGAKRALKAALRLKRDYADAHCDLGCTYCALDQVENAKQCFRNAVKCDPKHLEAHFNMGNLHRQCKQMESAIQSFNHVLCADPGHWRSLLNKAVVQTCIGDRDEAAFNLKQALRLSGQGGLLQQEIDQLKKMLRQGADWDAISQMMSYISDKAAQVESLGTGAAPTPQSRGLFSRGLGSSRPAGGASPARGASSVTLGARTPRSQLARLGYDVKAVTAAVDVPVLQHLAPLAEVKPGDLVAQAHDGNVASLKQGKQLRLTRAEALLRGVLHATPAAQFQHMMRTLNSRVLAPLDPGRTGHVDLAMLLMVLAALGNGGARGRVMAAFDILSWKKGSAGVTVQDAQAYVATLRRIFSPGHEEGGRRDSGDETSDSPTLDEAGFLAAVTNAESGFAMYEVLPALCHSLA